MGVLRPKHLSLATSVARREKINNTLRDHTMISTGRAKLNAKPSRFDSNLSAFFSRDII